MATDAAPTYPTEMPVLPVRDTVIFPLTVQPLAVSRALSIESVNRALASDRLLFIAAQANTSDEPQPDDVHRIGTIAAIRQMAKAPQGTHIVVEGLTRARADAVTRNGQQFRATVTPLPDPPESGIEIDAYMRRIQELLGRALGAQSGISQELKALVSGIDDPLRLTYVLASLLD